MQLDKQGPDGIERMREKFAALETKRKRLSELEAELEATKRDISKTEEDIRLLIAVGECTEANCEVHGATKACLPVVDDPSVPNVWRIAFHWLLRPGTSYYAIAQRIWRDPTLKKMTAKSRVSANLGYLKELGVLVRNHDGIYTVDPVRLVEASGIAIPEEADVPTE